ncbi:MAG: hypothetical protein WAY88_01610, partial [Minisyncoccia bacterium]
MKHIHIVLFITVLMFFAQNASAQTITCPLITSYLTIGSRSSQVIALKKYLVSEKILSAGLSTNYFGPSTA